MNKTNVDEMFRQLTFTKSAEEIVAKATTKTEAIKSKIAEREKRVVAIRQEHGIDEATLVSLFAQARKDDRVAMYNAGSNVFPNVPPGQQAGAGDRYIPAGVVRNLLTEYDLIEEERQQAVSLTLIARNLKTIPRFAEGNGAPIPPAEFALTRFELEFLGF